jgi:hypothetical protein
VTALADAIEARAQMLADRTLEAMYRNPFWDERFGERGRRFAREDNLHHIAYLVQALRAESADLLANYARWLQRVLTTRGMCSRHVGENFQRLAEAIRAEGIGDATPALALLDAASAALAYDGGPARAVQVAAGPVATRAAEAVYEHHPAWLAHEGVDGRARCRDDLLYHLSYLADALANGRPELFIDYIRWIAGFLERRGIPTEHLRETLAELDDALRIALAEDHDVVAALLVAGRAALAEDAAP